LSLKERIELLEADLKTDPPAFVMSHTLPFAIFRYDPQSPEEREWRVRGEIDKLAVRVQNSTRHRIGKISLAHLFWRSIRESEGVEALVALEKEFGFEAAQRQVHQYLSDPDYAQGLRQAALVRLAELSAKAGKKGQLRNVLDIFRVRYPLDTHSRAGIAIRSIASQAALRLSP